MTCRISLLLLFLCVLASVSSLAQWSGSGIMNRLGPQFFNPAACGQGGSMAFVADRHQWLDLPRTPVAQMAGIHLRMKGYSLGASFERLTNKVFSQYAFDVAYAKHLRLSGSGPSQRLLSFGTVFSWQTSSSDYSDLHTLQAGDPALGTTMPSQAYPNVCAGVHLHYPRWEADFAMHNMLNSIHQEEKAHPGYQMSFSFLAITDKSLRLQPNFLFVIDNQSFSLNTGVRIATGQRFEAGLWVETSGYAGEKSVLSTEALIVGHLTPALQLAYGVDYGLTRQAAHLGVSHEVLLAWSFKVKEHHKEVFCPAYPKPWKPGKKRKP